MNTKPFFKKATKRIAELSTVATLVLTSTAHSVAAQDYTVLSNPNGEKSVCFPVETKDAKGSVCMPVNKGPNERRTITTNVYYFDGTAATVTSSAGKTAISFSDGICNKTVGIKTQGSEIVSLTGEQRCGAITKELSDKDYTAGEKHMGSANMFKSIVTKKLNQGLGNGS